MKFARAAIAITLLGALAVSATPVTRAAARHSWTQPDHLRIGVVRDFDSLNPILSDQLAVTNLAQFLYSGLLRYDDNGNQIPDVATVVPSRANGGISADGKTITYHLRHDVKFSDGVPLTADDVVFTYHQVINPNNNVANRYPYELPRDVVAPDKYTVVVHLKQRSAPFLAIAFVCGVQGAIVPKHLLDGKADLNHDAFNSHPVGSGPYMVTRYTAGNVVEMATNPHYFRGAPKIARVSYRIIPSENTLLVATQTHEIDFYNDAPEQQYKTLQTLDGLRVVAKVVNSREWITFGTRRAPFDDVRVRQAAAFAIDWTALARNVYLSVDLPGTTATDVFPQGWAYTPVADPYPHDVGRAKALLAQAGWKPGPDGVMMKNGKRLEVELVTTNGVLPRQTAEVLIQQQLREAGIVAMIHNATPNALFDSYGANGILDRGRFNLALFGWTTTPDPDDTSTAGPGQVPPAGPNVSGLRDAELGQLQTQGAATYERSARRPIYAKIERRLAEQLPYRTIVWRANINAYNDDLRNVRPAPAQSDFWNIADWSF